jgi:hypothetical protein
MNQLNHFQPDKKGGVTPHPTWDDIKELQLENLALKGAVRESSQLIQSCVAMFQANQIPVPQEIAEFLGRPVPAPKKKRVSAHLTPSQMEAAYKGGSNA